MDLGLTLHSQSLIYRAKRAEILADNLANAETPNYKAKDLSFQDLLGKETHAIQMQGTHAAHINTNNQYRGADIVSQPASQVSVNGNSVDKHQELMRFSENAMRYQVSLQFLQNKFSGLKQALRGE